MANKAINAEIKRINGIIDGANVAPEMREMLAPIVEFVAWQRVTLDEACKELDGETLVIEYDNGGGQTGTRQNPLFKSVMDLWRGYIAGIDKLIQALPKEAQAEAKAKAVTPLEIVRGMKKKGTA